MDCNHVQRRIQDLTDGRLTDGVARELQRHLADCSDCRVAQQRAARLQQLLAIKRHETPGQHYLDNFLDNFHRRLDLESAPRPILWERMLGALHIQTAPTLRYGFAHAFGVLFAFGMILRGMIATDFSSDVSRVDAMSFGSPHLQVASVLPAPHSQPSRIASLLPRSPEPASTAGGALILPVAARGEPSTPRYVLDRISLSPASYEVASIHF